MTFWFQLVSHFLLSLCLINVSFEPNTLQKKNLNSARLHLQLRASDYALCSTVGVCGWYWEHCGSPWPHPSDKVPGQRLLFDGRGQQRAPERNRDHTYVFCFFGSTTLSHLPTEKNSQIHSETVLQQKRETEQPLLHEVLPTLILAKLNAFHSSLKSFIK